MQSKANGALMRVTPLAVWGHRLSDEQLADCARREAALTHPHTTCQVRMSSIGSGGPFQGRFCHRHKAHS